MRRIIGALLLGCISFSGIHADASTVAYWRFEDGTADTDVDHIAVTSNTYSADVLDVSGNGNHLSAWITGSYAGHAYRSDVPAATVAQTGEANNLSIQNTGDVPGLFTGPTGIQTIAPAEFTVEASFKLENGGYRTIVGRDSTDVVTGNSALAALYLQLMPDNVIAIKYADQAGYFHEALSDVNAVDTWAYDVDDPALADWYHVAAVSDGETLSLYLANENNPDYYKLVAQTDLTASGSPNTGLTAGAGDGGDWDAGNWTVGRGMYGGGHGDRAYGLIDEVRISDSALAKSEFLFVPEPTSIVLALFGVAALAAFRRR